MSGPTTAAPDSREVVIMADAWPESGLGHIARCTAISVALAARGVRCRRVAVGTASAPHSILDWECQAEPPVVIGGDVALLLLDSYRLDPLEVRERAGEPRLALMHDQGPLCEAAALTVTTDPQLAGTRPGVVGGPRFACLGPLYWGLPEPCDPPPRVRHALVATGGGDPGGHAVAVAELVREALDPDAEVTLVRGPHGDFAPPPGVWLLDRPRALLEALSRSELTVTACGSTLLEALAVGSPTVGLIMAENQRAKAQEIARSRATEVFEPGERSRIAAAVRSLAADAEQRRARSQTGRRLIDGYGALRVAFLLAGLMDQV